MWSGIPSTSQQHHRPGLGFRATLFLQADFHIFIDVPTIFWFCLPPLSGTFLQSHSLPHGTGSAASHLGLPTCRAARNGIRRAGEIDGRDLRAHWSWLACPVTTCTQRINKRSVGSTIPRPPYQTEVVLANHPQLVGLYTTSWICWWLPMACWSPIAEDITSPSPAELPWHLKLPGLSLWEVSRNLSRMWRGDSVVNLNRMINGLYQPSIVRV
jgi:hypothetical protein